MHITAIVEKEGGMFEFSAELSPQQHQFLLEYAIRDLVTRGLVPFDVVTDTDGSPVGIVPVPEPSKGH